MSRFRPSSRAVGWTSFALLLAAFAYAQHELLPPEPRWSKAGRAVSATLSSDGRLLLLPWFQDPVDPEAAQVRLWDVETGEERGRFDLGRGEQNTGGRVSMDPRGRVLAVEAGTQKGDGGGTVRWFDLSDGRITGSLPGMLPRFTADGRYLVVLTPLPDGTGCEVVYWDTERREPRHTLSTQGIPALHPDGRYLLDIERGEERRVTAWLIAARTGERRKLSEGGWVRSSAFSPDGNSAVVLGGGLEVWDTAAAGRRGGLTPASYFTPLFSPDCRQLIVFADLEEDRCRLLCVETANVKQLWERVIHSRLLGKVHWSNSGAVLVPDAGGGKVEFIDAKSGELAAVVPVLAERPGVTAKLSTSSSHGRFLRTRHLVELPPREPSAVGDLLRWLAGWLVPQAGSNTEVETVVDTESRGIVFQLDDPTLRTFGVSDTGLSDDGRSLITTHSDGTIRCFDVPARKPWRWVLGPPAALGAVVLAGRWAWRRRGSRKVVRA